MFPHTSSLELSALGLLTSLKVCKTRVGGEVRILRNFFPSWRSRRNEIFNTKRGENKD